MQVRPQKGQLGKEEKPGTLGESLSEKNESLSRATAVMR